jgi:hypothetical protein
LSGESHAEGGECRLRMAGTEFLVGTASWTDPTLVKSGTFYPPSAKTAEDRLRFYAEQFKTVEVDSTYYALPAERNAKLWAERTPDGFVFNIKPFALMTSSTWRACPSACPEPQGVGRGKAGGGAVFNNGLATNLRGTILVRRHVGSS